MPSHSSFSARRVRTSLRALEKCSLDMRSSTLLPTSVPPKPVMIINATSAGLAGDVPPFPDAILGPDVTCYDLSYAMKTTPFVAWATENGAKNVHQGWGMPSAQYLYDMRDKIGFMIFLWS